MYNCDLHMFSLNGVKRINCNFRKISSHENVENSRVIFVKSPPLRFVRITFAIVCLH